jgi:selenophosphate synthetase-related protein
MLLENAGLGAKVDLSRIDAPDSFELPDWLKVYPSYGFLLVCHREAKEAALRRFRERGIWANKIGHTDGSRELRLSWQGQEEVLFDFSKAGILNLPSFPL